MIIIYILRKPFNSVTFFFLGGGEGGVGAFQTASIFSGMGVKPSLFILYPK